MQRISASLAVGLNCPVSMELMVLRDTPSTRQVVSARVHVACEPLAVSFFKCQRFLHSGISPTARRHIARSRRGPCIEQMSRTPSATLFCSICTRSLAERYANRMAARSYEFPPFVSNRMRKITATAAVKAITPKHSPRQLACDPAHQGVGCPYDFLQGFHLCPCHPQFCQVLLSAKGYHRQ